MSAEPLEDGEIASEPEPTPEPTPEPMSPEELNDEDVIDEIVQKENSTAQRILSPQQPRRRNNRNERRRNSQRRQEALFTPPFEPQQQAMGTSWHTNGSGSSCNSGSGGRPMRQPPPESVIFGMAQTTPPMQNLVSNSYDYYPPPPGIHRVPLHFFPPPPPNNIEVRPLMSIPFQQRPLMMPPPPPPNLQPISPTPLPLSFDDNYENISMDMVSPEPQAEDPFVKPPIEIPLEAVVDAQKFVPKPVLEDEEALRAMLLSQLSQKKKRSAEKPSTSKSISKRVRKNSSRISASVENVFGTLAPISPAPPVPRIEVKLSTKTVENPAPVVLNQETPESPQSQPSSPAVTITESLSRDDRKAQLDLKMTEINKNFEEQRTKVSNASKDAKTAAEMAKRAAEMAKEAEEMNKKALEMRQRCIDDSKSGKEEMKKLLVEKRDIQNAIDMMSIDDMDDIDVEEFAEIIISEVKREPPRQDSDYRSPKREPLVTTENSLIDLNTAESSFREPETPQELVQNVVSQGEEEVDEEDSDEEEVEEEAEEPLDVTVKIAEEKEDDMESVEGEDEYEEVEEEEMTDPVSPEKLAADPTAPIVNGTHKNLVEKENMSNGIVSKPEPVALQSEAALRQRLMSKMVRPEKSPENNAPVVSSSMHDQAEECRDILLNMCKFELNGKCERPRDCTFLHLHNINDRKQQEQLLGGLFREIFKYEEEDIEHAIQQTLHFMPEFGQFEKMMEKFVNTIIVHTPDYKNKLFTFFALRR